MDSKAHHSTGHAHKRPHTRQARWCGKGARAAVLPLLLLSLATCTDEEANQQSLGLPFAADPADMPLHTGSLPNSRTSGLRQSGVFIQLPSGLPNELASLLLARFQEASIARQLPIARTGTVPEITVKGIARAGLAPNGTAVALVWEIFGPDGRRLKLLTGEALIKRSSASPQASFDAWAQVDADTLETLADQAAIELASWYQADFATPGESNLATANLLNNNGEGNPADIPTQLSGAPEKPIDLTTPSLLQQATGIQARNASLNTAPPSEAVGDIITASIAHPTRQAAASVAAETIPKAAATTPTLARNLFDVAVGTSPGDGQLSLAAAVQEALLEAGQSGAPRAYRVLGQVTLSRAETGKAHVTIDWTVAAKDGVALGLVSQSNIVEAQEISGAWGPVAKEAGSAAAQGILDLISTSAPKA